MTTKAKLDWNMVPGAENDFENSPKVAKLWNAYRSKLEALQHAKSKLQDEINGQFEAAGLIPEGKEMVFSYRFKVGYAFSEPKAEKPAKKVGAAVVLK